MKVIILLSIALTSSSFALSLNMLRISNNIDTTDIVCMSARVNESYDIEELVFTECGEGIEGPRVIRVTSEDLTNSNANNTIYRRSRRDIVSLSSSNFSATYGGEVSIVYLTNGITGKHRHITLDFEREGNAWTILYRDSEVTSLQFQARRAAGRVIGIRRININQ